MVLPRRSQRRLGDALRNHRPLRNSVIQVIYLIPAVVLGFVLPRIGVDPRVDGGAVATMLFATGSGVIGFVGVVYSLLFLVVQFGTTTYTPRLNLFRDSPLVWHAFAFYIGVVVFSITAGFVASTRDEVSAVVPTASVATLVGALWLFAALQSRAFAAIQLAALLDQVTSRGHAVIGGVYPDSRPATPSEPDLDPRHTLGTSAGRETEVVLKRPWGIIQSIDVVNLIALAEFDDAVIQTTLVNGATAFRGEPYAHIYGGGDSTAQGVEQAFIFGAERTFDQDPGLALRVLADIALKALSAAINDPTTAVQALDGTESILRDLAGRDLDIRRFEGAGGELRVILAVPTWEQFVGVALDEVIGLSPISVQVQNRLHRLFDNLARAIPPERWPALQERSQRFERLTASQPR